MHSILDQEMPGLSARLASLSADARQRVVSKACRVVAESLDDLDDNVHAIVDRLTANTLLTTSDLATVQELAESADAKYLELQERDQGAALEAYSAARFLTAVSAGCRAATAENACEAIYELSKAVDDTSALIKSIESEIEAIGGD